MGRPVSLAQHGTLVVRALCSHIRTVVSSRNKKQCECESESESGSGSWRRERVSERVRKSERKAQVKPPCCVVVCRTSEWIYFVAQPGALGSVVVATEPMTGVTTLTNLPSRPYIRRCASIWNAAASR